MIKQLRPVIITALVACGGGSGSVEQADLSLPGEIQETVEMRELATGVMGPSSAVEALINDSARLAARWPHSEPAPDVDFDSEMVVIVALGSRPTGGYYVKVTSVEASDGSILVRYEEGTPGPGCMVPQVITAPYQVVAVPKKEGTPRFQREVTTVSC
jgi:hypothetical protein